MTTASNIQTTSPEDELKYEDDFKYEGHLKYVNDLIFVDILKQIKPNQNYQTKPTKKNFQKQQNQSTKIKFINQIGKSKPCKSI